MVKPYALNVVTLGSTPSLPETEPRLLINNSIAF